MNANELSSISKTKVPTQGDTSATAVTIAIDATDLRSRPAV